MKIILKQDVPKIGKKFETKNVSDGYALNFLIPKGLAEVATTVSIKKAGEALKALEALKKVHEDLILKNLKNIDGVTINISDKANEKGHLFAGIHKDQIIAELKKETRLEVLPEFIDLEKPIKEVGEHSVKVTIQGKTATFKVVVSAK